MAKIDVALIQQLRERTGLGMMDCKKALEETDGNIDQAVDLLRKKGALVAAKRAEKTTAEGIIQAYIHPGNQVGVLVEINCETDFVARTEGLKQFASDLCMHIAAIKPLYLAPEDVDAKFLEHERNILKEQLVQSGKAEKFIDKILEGKLQKLYSEICLLNQPFVKNDQFTVDQMVQELIAKTGEKIKIKRFARYEIGG
ncbi:elongation factor Ts [Candidatus Dependentiae bacterium Noda2021]|nr:elongation factor Ts [Candidatus Dependentiae bacterium Noda2021]